MIRAIPSRLETIVAILMTIISGLMIAALSWFSPHSWHELDVPVVLAALCVTLFGVVMSLPRSDEALSD